VTEPLRPLQATPVPFLHTVKNASANSAIRLTHKLSVVLSGQAAMTSTRSAVVVCSLAGAVAGLQHSAMWSLHNGTAMSGWGTLTFDSSDLTQIATNYEKGIHVSSNTAQRPCTPAHMYATDE
jgi:hypothetical protein